ncbi:DUF1073 domain-containing protein [Paracoccus sp. p4-l81]|uniref:DUF1073 domain-containing protein n=1 Tax=Paracoccus sp. p4-l81 TaxID=3342806 RepID=UPI0035B94BC8
MGTSRDKAAGATYRMVRLADAELISAYRSTWLARKIVDIPAKDATRRWRAWQAAKDQITEIEAEEARIGLKGAVLKALVSARLLGGAAIYIGTGDGNPDQPLLPERIGKGGIQHLTVIARDKLHPGEIDYDPDSPEFGKPAFYRLHRRNGDEVRIHPSRLVLFHGALIPEGADLIGDGWGDSALQSCLDAVKCADGIAANAGSLVYEANVDVLHIPQLMARLAEPGGDVEVARYLTMLAVAKGNNGMLVLDGGALVDGKTTNRTDYERKGVAFGGLAEIWDRAMQTVSGAADIPATRLFGMSPAGQNATGESDLQNYAQRIAALQEMEIGPALTVLDECLIRSALGARPPEIYYDWRPIREATAKERAEVGAQTAGIISTLAGAQLFPVETLQQAAANAMIETGALPGLEGAVEEFGLDLEAEAADPRSEEGDASGQPDTTFRL